MRSLSINRPRTFDCEVLRLDREDQSNIPVVECRITSQWNRIRRVILLAIGTAQQFALRGNMQGDIALHLDCSDKEHASGNNNRSSLILATGIDGRLQSAGVKTDTVTLSAKVPDVVNACAQSPIVIRLLTALHRLREAGTG